MEGEIVKTLKWAAFGQIFAMPFLVLAQSPATTSPQTATSQAKPVQKQSYANDGARIFTQNCSRCHNAPDGFSPRIAGSVVRHMRVRANLSEKDAQAVLRFFNP
jgi:mono/diheme cytochrome c family protein